MLTDEEIQRIKKNLPSAELKLFQSFISIYHASQQQNKTLLEGIKRFADHNNWTWGTFRGDVIAEWSTIKNGHPDKLAQQIVDFIQK